MNQIFKVIWESEIEKIKETHFMWGWPKTTQNMFLIDNLKTHIKDFLQTEILQTNHTLLFDYLENFRVVPEQKKFLPLTLGIAHQLGLKNLFHCTLLQNSGLYALGLFFQEHFQSKHLPLCNHLFFELHPLISSLIAESKNSPQEVVETILHHHDNPTSLTSPLLATLKAINWLADISPSVTLDLCKKTIEKLDQIPFKATDLYEAWKESFQNLGKNSLQ